MRPRILLNCAISDDDRMAGEGGVPVRLSDEVDWRRVHQLRARCDAILVGVGTILCDDPSLRVKPEYAGGPDPRRVILDTHGRAPRDARAFPALHMTAENTPVRDGRIDLEAAMRQLAEEGVKELLVEGGPTILAAFVEAGLWDVFTVYQAPVTLGVGPELPAMALPDPDVVEQGAGLLCTFRNSVDDEGVGVGSP